ncbi:UDP-N-acetylmuramate--L-alanine ligase [Plantactinospora mayteni]|uniref:UDP-N-acetylmuramate--L-alanine ligase n=1 Tax=Plantactinospora mayteni TaxID=566021 RepID=A0ABQ4EXS5_9ACTN|nr:UDP-N-acetylmuramate--L-alanine ligase [Plantactinospora mayteni]GIG99470.1 UDP-N-acetylmuramate--L-alanine ligase [Plantactinospora mayteni]
MTDTLTGNPTRDPYTGPFDLSRPHFVGIGGTAMSGLARLLMESGHRVTGSDIASSVSVATLRLAGITVHLGHRPEHIVGASCVVYTTVAGHNAEVTAAREAGIPVVHRAQVLDALSAGHRLVAVSGSHGKSTTTALLATTLRDLGTDPTYLIGANLRLPGSGARLGGSDLLIAEADESDRSFHFLTPWMAVISNVTDDHPENFVDHADLVNAYTTFAQRITSGGVLVVNADDDGAMEVASRIRVNRPDVRVVRYGRHVTADIRLINVTARGWGLRADVALPERRQVTLALATPATHHAHNAVAALACAVALGIDADNAARAISTFAGVRRRFEHIDTYDGVTVIDTYADHPDEIHADLSAARTLTLAGGRVLVVFQPSGHARVTAFGDRIGATLAEGADHVMLLDVHGTLPPGQATADTGALLPSLGDGRYTLALSREHATSSIAAMAKPGDVVVTMGTGDVTTYGPVILDHLTDRAVQVA